MSSMGEIWMGMGTLMGGIMFAYTMIQQFVPRHVADYLSAYMHRTMAFANPYMEISFDEFTGVERLKLSQAYSAVEAYLGPKSSKLAKRLKAQIVKGHKDLAFSMDDYEEIIDDFQGVKIWWSMGKTIPETKSFSYYPSATEKRHLRLKFHRRHRETVTKSYLKHVIKVGKASMIENRHIRLYSNNANQGYYEYKKTLWGHVEFEHPVTFDHLAMDPVKKQEIIDDLVTFSMSRDYYMKIGKPWKRGYLLYGPPGTGKSSMIAAMAKLLNYDIYDLELTAVKDNSELKKLLQDTSNKSITVIEDVDCSLDLTGKRKKKKKKDDKEEKDPIKEKADDEEEESKQDSKVTLSGLLNVIDGLWSACGKERIIVFTTNYVEKLDPALIRRGRMDKHIEMSYCCFEGFKVFAKNYLDLESHELFDTVRRLIVEVKVSPADVAENLMPKTMKRDSRVCLQNLIKTLEKIKEDEKLIAEEESKKKENDGLVME
ncbi:hypothetical protein C5167_011262 [Papaver somniferum]|uniref:AAA+ ATPase domain-containing protein n=1 Tax=Papaver somniferum TaxID=3469 RepID=A0A4Y7K5E6_PAPSO|nr:AAA-ATPase ASD, mitochondrial-like [Papaver somniferum]RZC67570.1 hypothetical protein C5167_011262 [Papaver somniferum]